MIDPDDPDDRRLILEMAMRRIKHPVIKETRRYYRREIFARLSRAAFVQAPILVLLIFMTLSVAGIEIYLAGFFLSVWWNWCKPWVSPMDDTIDLYLELDYALGHDS